MDESKKECIGIFFQKQLQLSENENKTDVVLRGKCTVLYGSNRKRADFKFKNLSFDLMKHTKKQNKPKAIKRK